MVLNGSNGVRGIVVSKESSGSGSGSLSNIDSFSGSGSALISGFATGAGAVYKTADLFTIGGDGFLYHMVRNLVWSLVQVGLGKRTPKDFAEELTAKRCEFLNEPAPAQGLYLKEVFYTEFEA